MPTTQEEIFKKLVDYLLIAIDAGIFKKNEIIEIYRLVLDYNTQGKKEN